MKEYGLFKNTPFYINYITIQGCEAGSLNCSCLLFTKRFRFLKNKLKKYQSQGNCFDINNIQKGCCKFACYPIIYILTQILFKWFPKYWEIQRMDNIFYNMNKNPYNMMSEEST